MKIRYTTSLHMNFCGFPTLCIRVILMFLRTNYSSRFHPFYRPRRPLGRVEVQLYSILDLGTRRGLGVSVTPRPYLTPGKDPVPILQEAGWASGPVWTGVENLAPPGFDSRTVQPIGSRQTTVISINFIQLTV